MTVFPVIYDNSYFNILETKYKCYYISVIGMLALVPSIVMLIIDFMEFKGEHVKALLGKLAPRNWMTTFCVVDVATFLISGMVMCVIGISDYFQMDIFDFRRNIKPEQFTLFTSTVGNIDTYTAYVALSMGLASAMFATTKSLAKSV